MSIKVIFFGQLKEIAGGALEVEDVHDTHDLQQTLYSRYPVLSSMQYRIVVDKELINDIVPLHPGVTVALLPPYSGG